MIRDNIGFLDQFLLTIQDISLRIQFQNPYVQTSFTEGLRPTCYSISAIRGLPDRMEGIMFVTPVSLLPLNLTPRIKLEDPSIETLIMISLCPTRYNVSAILSLLNRVSEIVLAATISLLPLDIPEAVELQDPDIRMTSTK